MPFSIPTSTTAISVLRIVLRSQSSTSYLARTLQTSSPSSISSSSTASSPSTTAAQSPVSSSTSKAETSSVLSASGSLDPSLPSEPPTKPPISHETFLKLHRLSALNPPKPGSEEESMLKSELNDLINLMDMVKDVELPVYPESEGGRDRMVRELLGRGVGEIVIDGSHEMSTVDESEDIETQNTVVEESNVEDEKSGRELLDYGTRRRGDYYAFRAGQREN